MSDDTNIEQYNRDVQSFSGYEYTSSEKLSTRIAIETLDTAFKQITSIRGKKVLDIGCGDGTFMRKLIKEDPKYLLGIDAAEHAITFSKKTGSTCKNMEFRTANAYDELPKLEGQFDIAILRGILHHVDEPEKLVALASRVAGELIILEPNGYNMILKIIEKTSKYHIEHSEKSYSPHKLNKWAINAGGIVTKSAYRGLVPFFCPDWLAIICKYLEPLVEKTPLFRAMVCATYIQKITFKTN